MRSYTTPLRRHDKVSRGCRRGRRTSERSTDTTLHQFHRQPALSFICAIRATPFVTFSSLSLSLSFILASSLSHHGLTIVSRDRVRATKRQQRNDDYYYVLFRNLFLCLATLFFLPFVRCHCHRFRRRRR